jgi:hypothetical protein
MADESTVLAGRLDRSRRRDVCPVSRDQALALRGCIGADGWVLLIELNRQILKRCGRNPVRL